MMCFLGFEMGAGLELKDILVWFQGRSIMEKSELFSLFFTPIFQAAKSSVKNG